MEEASGPGRRTQGIVETPGNGGAPKLGQAGQVVPNFEERKWYHRFTEKKSTGDKKETPTAKFGRGAFLLLLVLAAASGGLIAVGILGAAPWTWKAGFAGLLLALVLFLVLSISLERKLWAAFFGLIAAVVASLGGPTANVGFGANVDWAKVDGTVSWGPSLVSSGVLAILAVIVGLFALKVRKG